MNFKDVIFLEKNQKKIFDESTKYIKYPAITRLESLAFKSTIIYQIVLLIIIVLMFFYNTLGNLVFIIGSIIVIASPIIIYLINSIIIPKIVFKNYNDDLELQNEYESILLTEKIEVRSKEQLSTRMKNRLTILGYNIDNTCDNILFAYKILKPKDIRIGWTYTYYEKFKFNLVLLYGENIVLNDLLNEDVLEESIQNFVVCINKHYDCTEEQLLKYKFNSETDKIFNEKYHLKIFDFGYEVNKSALRYRKPYIKVMFNSNLLKKGIQNNDCDPVNIKSIYDEASSSLLMSEIKSIILEK